MQVLGGMELTGPSLNPAVTFSWAVHHRQHRLAEHLIVFWLAPIAGGMHELDIYPMLTYSTSVFTEHLLTCWLSGALPHACWPQVHMWVYCHESAH